MNDTHISMHLLNWNIDKFVLPYLTLWIIIVILKLIIRIMRRITNEYQIHVIFPKLNRNEIKLAAGCNIRWQHHHLHINQPKWNIVFYFLFFFLNMSFVVRASFKREQKISDKSVRKLIVHVLSYKIILSFCMVKVILLCSSASSIKWIIYQLNYII